MAVYTKISIKDVSLINKKFNVENFKSFKGIKQTRCLKSVLKKRLKLFKCLEKVS